MWSSQSYENYGRDEHQPQQLIDRAIFQSELVNQGQYSCPSILSLNHLAFRTGVGYEWLRSYVMRGLLEGLDGYVRPYRKFAITKRSGGRRSIHIPAPRLMHTQRWINHHILKRLPVHPASHAFVKGGSIKKCAARHCGAKWLIKIDIKDFFGSISEIQVYRIFQSVGYQPLVAFELARLCTITPGERSPRNHLPQWQVRKPNFKIPTYHRKLLGYLPQGAPTSPNLANLVMFDCDKQLNALANDFGLNYTRYSDDLCFSSRKKDFGRKQAEQIIAAIYAILNKAGYRPNLRKTSIVPPSAKKVVLGLNIDRSEPMLPKETKDRIRQHIYYLEKFGPVQHAYKRGFDSVWGLKSHVRGLIDFANMIEGDFAKGALLRFNKINWPV